MSDLNCNGIYKECTMLNCAGKQFPCINESRRLETANKIKNKTYQLGWDTTPEWTPPKKKKNRKGSPGTIIGKRKIDSLRNKKTINELRIPADQIGLELVPNKGYPYTLPDGKIVYTLFFVRGDMVDILLRDRQCVFCGTTDMLTRDHIMPVSKGGSNKPINLQVLCIDCNGEKKDKIPSGLTHDQRQKLYK